MGSSCIRAPGSDILSSQLMIASVLHRQGLHGPWDPLILSLRDACVFKPLADLSMDRVAQIISAPGKAGQVGEQSGLDLGSPQGPG